MFKRLVNQCALREALTIRTRSVDGTASFDERFGDVGSAFVRQRRADELCDGVDGTLVKVDAFGGQEELNPVGLTTSVGMNFFLNFLKF